MGHIHSHTPLWVNNHLAELKQIPDPAIWANYGIIYLHQVMTNSRPKTFQSLKEDYSIPHQLMFRYLQLRHALRSQVRDESCNLDCPQILYIIMGSESQKLISNLYYSIRLPRINEVVQKAKIRWERDVGAVSDSDWEELLENVKTTSP